MKQTPSTFVLNRNDKQYFFVEGKDSLFYGPSYHVYYDKDEKPIYYRAENFVEIHGLDEKQHISSFAEQALLNLRILLDTNDEADKTYKQLYDVYMQVKDVSDAKKPVLSSSAKLNLIEAIDGYNRIKDSLSYEIDIP